MAAKVKGVQRAVLDALRESPNGLSDFDLEDRLGRTHQTTSGARRGLVLKGLVEDSGSRAVNRYGSEVIVWRLTDSPGTAQDGMAP
jgi:DNA-binding IclR family transcriptional regulator